MILAGKKPTRGKRRRISLPRFPAFSGEDDAREPAAICPRHPARRDPLGRFAVAFANLARRANGRDELRSARRRDVVLGIKTTRIRSLDGEQIIRANSDSLETRVRNFQRM
jgi:hypothetical protein